MFDSIGEAMKAAIEVSRREGKWTTAHFAVRGGDKATQREAQVAARKQQLPWGWYETAWWFLPIDASTRDNYIKYAVNERSKDLPKLFD